MDLTMRRTKHHADAETFGGRLDHLRSENIIRARAKGHETFPCGRRLLWVLVA